MEGPEVEPGGVRTSEPLFLIRSDVPSESRLRRKHLEKEIGELSPVGCKIVPQTKGRCGIEVEFCQGESSVSQGRRHEVEWQTWGRLSLGIIGTSNGSWIMMGGEAGEGQAPGV